MKSLKINGEDYQEFFQSYQSQLNGLLNIIEGYNEKVKFIKQLIKLNNLCRKPKDNFDKIERIKLKIKYEKEGFPNIYYSLAPTYDSDNNLVEAEQFLYPENWQFNNFITAVDFLLKGWISELKQVNPSQISNNEIGKNEVPTGESENSNSTILTSIKDYLSDEEFDVCINSLMNFKNSVINSNFQYIGGERYDKSIIVAWVDVITGKSYLPNMHWENKKLLLENTFEFYTVGKYTLEQNNSNIYHEAKESFNNEIPNKNNIP